MKLFQIPAHLENVRFSALSVSKELVAAFGKLKLRCFGDLSQIGRRHLRTVSQHPDLLIKELAALIDRSRAKITEGPGFAKGSRDDARCPSKRAPRTLMNHTPRSDFPSPTPLRQRSPGHIFIPAVHRNRPLPTTPAVSVRLSNILNKNRFRILGDLHGLRVSDFRQLRGSGKQSLLEFEGFLRGIGGGFTTAELLTQPAFTPPPPRFKTLFIADFARGLCPSDLPLSVRARNVLEGFGVKCLGDLNGVTTSALLDLEHSGKKTVLEIKTVLERANSGEFDTSPLDLQKLTPLDLLLRIDKWLSQLPERHSQFVRLRFGGNGRPPLTLASIGAQGGVTRERIRQIVRSALASFVRRAGPTITTLLDQVARATRKHADPLPLEVIREWAPTPWRLSCKPEFYGRIIVAIKERIAARPGLRFA